MNKWNRRELMLATKVWADGRDAGIEQMNRSASLMNRKVIDRMQVHNLHDTALHMETIREWQDSGRIRYSGLTHYMTKDQGVAVLINRPFQSGRLFRAVSGKPLPDWAKGFAASWGQFFLKFVISHPAVTCVIPATSKMRQMIDNLGAGTGPIPDSAAR